MMDGGDFGNAKKTHRNGIALSSVRQFLTDLQLNGIRYFRDGGDAFGVSLAARELAPDYGIHYVTPAFAIHRKGCYGGIVGRGYSDLRDFRERILEIQTEGGTFAKLMLSGIITFRQYGELSCPGLPTAEIREITAIAHDAGYPVMVHVNGNETVRAAISAGVDSIEHGYFMNEETLHALAGSNTVWVPTLAAIEAFIGRDGFNSGVASETLSRQMESLRIAASLGAHIAAGSDSGAVGVPHGQGTKNEYRLLREAGVSKHVIEEGNARIAALFR